MLMFKARINFTSILASFSTPPNTENQFHDGIDFSQGINACGAQLFENILKYLVQL
jgi:hypothetical protein